MENAYCTVLYCTVLYCTYLVGPTDHLYIICCIELSNNIMSEQVSSAWKREFVEFVKFFEIFTDSSLKCEQENVVLFLKKNCFIIQE